MDDLGFFDAYCVVGRHLRLTPEGLHTARDLLGEMDHLGIAEAMVVDSLSRECHVADGNLRVLEVCRESPRLHTAWAALPPGVTDEQPSPEELLAQMRRRRVGALFLFTGQYQFNLTDWCVDELLAPMAEAGVPVFVVPNDIGPGPFANWDRANWKEVVQLCRRLPKLPVVVSEIRIRRVQRMIYRALDACDNLHIELSGYWLHHGIEYVTRRWGSRRLIFGSNWPQWGQAMTVASVSQADISDEDKRSIAGDNLRRLISWCKPERPAVELPPPADEFVQFARTGRRPAGMTFLDCHGHFGRASHYHLPDSSLEDVVAEMDRMGVRKVLLFGFAGVFSDERFGNDVVAEALRRHPDRFVGLAVLNPHRGKEGMLQEMHRCGQMGFRGIKLIAHYQIHSEEGPWLDVPCRWAHERRQIVLNHNWGSPAQMERLVSAYPDACFITGHSTGAYAEIMKKHPNLYVCTCPLAGPRDCERLVASIGAERLLFGSDLLDLPISWGLGPVLFARISPEQKRMILGENLRQVLERCGLQP
jgi:hypothetical protein